VREERLLRRLSKKEGREGRTLPAYSEPAAVKMPNAVVAVNEGFAANSRSVTGGMVRN
jgi:hypothetical protein